MYCERRRIEGELHDGVQQHLVALVVNLQLAQELAAADPPALMPLLEEIANDVREALVAARALAHEIYPPLLLDRGLGEAIAAAAAASAFPTRVELESVERYDENVEAAVYFCCIDALRDAAVGQSAGGTVRIWEEPGTLSFAVVARGWPAGQIFPTRSTLDSVRDRVGAVGGLVSVHPISAGGCCVSGSIPVGA